MTTFVITRNDGNWWNFRYAVRATGKYPGQIATITLTLYGARWWIRHRAKAWLDEQRRLAGPERPIEQHEVET